MSPGASICRKAWLNEGLWLLLVKVLATNSCGEDFVQAQVTWPSEFGVGWGGSTCSGPLGGGVVAVVHVCLPEYLTKAFAART